MTNEKIVFNYKHSTTYTNTPGNAVGANTSLTSRTVTAHTDSDCKYVRKFGIDYAIGDITNAVIEHIRSAGGNSWKFDFYGLINNAWVLMGSVKDESGASTFTDEGAGTATRVKIVITCINGSTTLVDGDHITLTTDTDAGGLTVLLPKEELNSATNPTLTLYLSATGSTYYDNAMTCGGWRHTPDGTAKYPYFKIQDAFDVLGGAFVTVSILDSAVYEENLNLNGSAVIQAVLGQTPTIRAKGYGARTTREPFAHYTNTNAIYWNETGNDSNNGSWQAPIRTLASACTAGYNASKNVVYGGYGFTNGENIISTQIDRSATAGTDLNFYLDADVGCIAKLYCSVSGVSATIACKYKSIGGFQIDNYGTNKALVVSWTVTNSFADMTMQNGSAGYFRFADMNYCRFENIYSYIQMASLTTGNCQFNLFKNAPVGITTFEHIDKFSDNICYSTSWWCLYCDNSAGAGIDTEMGRNIFAGQYGVYYRGTAMTSDACLNNIFQCSITDFQSGTGNDELDYCRVAKVVNLIAGKLHNCISADAELCDPVNGYYGVSSSSPCYRTASDAWNMGTRNQSAVLGANNIVLNGFIFDGAGFYDSAIVQNATQTGIQLLWVTVQNYVGIAFDCFATADTSAIVNNSIFRTNGDGIRFAYGANIVTYSLIYSHGKYGIWADYTGHTFTHLVFYGNYYGIYLSLNCSNISFQDNISDQNSYYGIYSSVAISIIYTCFTDATSAFVDISSDTNIESSPMFKDTTIGAEDLNLKSIASGYFIDSPCIDSASDGSDMGAYIVSNSTADDSWKNYQLEHNPRVIDFNHVLKGTSTFDNALGVRKVYGLARKRQFVFRWADKQYVTETLRKTIEYIASLQRTRENALTDEQTKIRVSFLPVQFLATGSSGVISSANKTLTDTSKSMLDDEHRGFHIGIKVMTGTAVIDAVAKTVTVSGASWTSNEFVGLQMPYNKRFYYVKSNTSNVLTISDPEDTLTNASGVSVFVARFFKILSNTATVFSLKDDDGDLASLDGLSKTWYIDFIECRTIKADFKYNQARFYYQQEEWKGGFDLTLEEI